MPDLLARFDRLRAEDPAKAADLLSRLAESDWEMTFKGNPRPEHSGPRWRARREPPVDLNPPKHRKVRRFVRNPKGEIDAEYTRDPKFGWDLLAYCSEYVDAIPARGQRLTKKALIVFARNERYGLPEAACMVVAAQGVLAFADYMLDNFDEAVSTFKKALESSESRRCAGCKAGTLRKLSYVDKARAYLGMDPHGYPHAHDKSSEAIQLYSDPQTTDHDLLGHGLAHSYMTRGVILSSWGHQDKALSDLTTAIQMCSTRSRLFVLCVGNTAIALLRSGREEHLLRAAELVVGLKKKFARRRKASTGRAMTLWLEGQISARIGATADAIDCHEEALDDFVELKAFVNSSAVVSDLSKLTVSTPSRIRDHIHRLDPERTRECPSWMPGFLQHHLSKLYRLSGSRSVDQGVLLQAIGDLRKASGCRFPCLI